MSLHINMTTGSQQLADSNIAQAITALAAAVKDQEKQGLVPLSPCLEITFMLPGKLDKPDFSGMRMGCYNSDPGTLAFERSVPEHILYSAHSFRFVTLVLQDMVDNARSYFQGIDESFDYASWQQLANSMEAKFVHTH